MKRLRIGTRSSRLALAQSGGVADLLRARSPDLDVTFVEIRTSGDAIRHEQLGPELGQSFFTKEIEDALLDGRIDLAVHSCKDLASTLPAGLRIVAIPRREDPYDALVTGGARLSELHEGARIGTSSVRRQRFLSLARPDLVVENLRGNVPTRVRAVDEGRVDGVVVASAGLRRLGHSERIVEALKPPLMVPAAAQGALALEAREDDASTRAYVEALDHPASHAEVRAERACLRHLAAGCQAPVGVLARAEDDELRVQATVVSPERAVGATRSAPAAEAEELGTGVAAELLGQLGLPSLSGVEWAGPPPLAR